MLRRCSFTVSATSSPVKASDRPNAHLSKGSNLKKSQRSAARCFRGGSAVCSQQKALGGQPRAFRSGRAREMGAQAGAAVSSAPAWIVRPLGGCVIPVQRMPTIDRCGSKPLHLSDHLSHDRAVLVHQPGAVLTPRRSYGAAPGRTPHTAAPLFHVDSGWLASRCSSAMPSAAASSR